MAASAAQILAVLPQTQCTRCGYPDCAGYAHAIVQGDAGINQCPPGGAQGIQRLAAVTGQPVTPLNPHNGTESVRCLAIIDEDWCIGCTLCITACPTDAIFGTHKRMHTVIEAYCTGCELCLPVCPVDCIRLTNASGHATGWKAWSSLQADQARSRYEDAQRRRGTTAGAPMSTPMESIAHEGMQAGADSVKAADSPTKQEVSVADRKKAAIDAALERARARRRSASGTP